MKFKKKRRAMSAEMSLNITAMADIFTVLLVFLLKSFSTSAIEITPTAGLILPKAQANSEAVEALKIEISEKAVMVETQPSVDLNQFKFVPSELTTDGASKNLVKELRKAKERQLLIAKENADVKLDPKIVIIADERTPYSTIKTVLASAALNGYTDFKLAVVRQE